MSCDYIDWILGRTLTPFLKCSSRKLLPRVLPSEWAAPARTYLLLHIPKSLKPFTVFSYYCGVRLGEAKQIGWSRVNFG